MPIARVRDAAQHGIVKDIPAHELPREAWSDGNNVRFRARSVRKMSGHDAVFGSPSVAPYWLLPVQDGSTYYWVYAGAAKVYVTSGSTHYNITRQSGGVDVDYSATYNSWTGGIFNGVPFLNNGVDAPQVWTPVNTTTRLEGLANWPADTTCGALRPFKNYLVALDVTKSSGTRYAQLIKWSDQADPGSVPGSWDETDTTVDAGETSLAETPGACVDALQLRDQLIIYKEDAVYSMTYIGGQYIFAFRHIFNRFGILARNCVAEFDGKHLVLANGDVIVHDGQTYKSIVDQRWREYLFDAIDSSNYTRCFVATNYQQSEIWICFPETGQSLCTKALVWNWREDKFSARDLPNAAYAGLGVIDPATDVTWASDTETWAEETTSWDQKQFNPTQQNLLIADASSSALYQADQTQQFDGTNFTAYVQREAVPLSDDPVINISRRKIIKRVWPRITATNGTTVNVYVGYQNTIGDAVSWSSALPYVVGTNDKVDCLVEGRIPAIKFETASNSAWKLNGYDIEYEPLGQF